MSALDADAAAGAGTSSSAVLAADEQQQQLQTRPAMHDDQEQRNLDLHATDDGLKSSQQQHTAASPANHMDNDSMRSEEAPPVNTAVQSSSSAQHDESSGPDSSSELIQDVRTPAPSAPAAAVLEQNDTALTASFHREIAALKSELGSVLSHRAELEIELDRLKTDAATRCSLADARAAAAESAAAEATAKWNGMLAEHESLRLSKNKAEESLSSTQDSLAQTSVQLALARAQIAADLEAAQRNLPWKMQCSDLTAQLASQKKAMRQTISTLVATVATLRHDIVRFKQILLYITASAFVKLWQTKKALRSMHVSLSEMLVNVLEAHLLATGGGAFASSAGANAGGSNIPSLALVGSSTGALVPASGESSQSGEGAILQELKKSLARKKRHYLDAIFTRPGGGGNTMNNGANKGGFFKRGVVAGRGGGGGGSSTADDTVGSSILSLVSSLEEELYKLKSPFEEVQERVGHWRRSSESFAARGVELTSSLVEVRERNQMLERENAHMLAEVRTVSREHNELLDSHAKLKADHALLRTELSQAREALKSHVASTDLVGSRKREVENLESKIGLARSQLAYVQKRYVHTAHALREMLHQAGQGDTNSLANLSLAPPAAGPHYPPPPPSSASTTNLQSSSPSMTQLFASTVALHGQQSPSGAATVAASNTQSLSSLLSSAAPAPATAPAASASLSQSPSTASCYAPAPPAHIPLPHEDPELHHSLSLQNFHSTEQQEMARMELDKWRALQFVLENNGEESVLSATKSSGKKRGKGKKVLGSSTHSSTKSLHASRSSKGDGGGGGGDPLVDTLSSLPEIAALNLQNNYASVFSARNYTTRDPIFDAAPAAGGGAHSARVGAGTGPMSLSRAAEEERAHAALFSSPSQRIRLIKTAMGRGAAAQGDTSSLRSNNQYYAYSHSRDTTDIGQNGALRSVGASPAMAVAGGAASPAVVATAMSSYSSFAPTATTSERAAAEYSRTLMLLKRAPATLRPPARGLGPTGGNANATVSLGADGIPLREGGGTRDFENVYAQAVPRKRTVQEAPPVPSGKRDPSAAQHAGKSFDQQLRSSTHQPPPQPPHSLQPLPTQSPRSKRAVQHDIPEHKQAMPMVAPISLQQLQQQQRAPSVHEQFVGSPFGPQEAAAFQQMLAQLRAPTAPAQLAQPGPGPH